MAKLRFLILGDDFTPAALFEDTIRQNIGRYESTTSFQCVDIDPSELSRAETEEVSEAFGDVHEIARLARSCHVIVTTFAPITKLVLDEARDLIAIACGRGGPINVNVPAATGRGIPVLFAPGRNAQAVAEYTLAAMISLMRRMPEALDYVRERKWQTPREDTFEKPSGPELGGRCLGLIGCGQVGCLVGKLALAFGARVLVHDPYADDAMIKSLGLVPVTLETLLSGADVISVHARIGSGEPALLDRAAFAAMKRRPYVLNTARAAALDYEALTDALQDEVISGAFLDVYPDEPIPDDSPLLSVDRGCLLLTPHAAGVSYDIPATTAGLLAKDLASLLGGSSPDHVVNRETLDICFERLGALLDC